MLVLTRKTDEAIVVAGAVTVRILEVRGNRVLLGIQGPRDIAVHREEVHRQREALQPEPQAAERSPA